MAKKPEVKKKTVAQYVDETLDDPVAEKARRQKLVEEADLAAAKELFGTDGEEIDLTTYNPKSAKEFTKFGTLLASKFLIPIKESAFFKETIKAFVKSAMKYMTVVDIKEVEATVVATKRKGEGGEGGGHRRAKGDRRGHRQGGQGQEEVPQPGTKGGTTASRTSNTPTTPSTTTTIYVMPNRRPRGGGLSGIISSMD